MDLLPLVYACVTPIIVVGVGLVIYFKWRTRREKADKIDLDDELE